MLDLRLNTSRSFVTGSLSDSVRFLTVHLKSLPHIAAATLTLGVLAGCAQVLGLQDDYYIVSDVDLGGASSTGGGGSAGTGGESAMGGEAGALNEARCADHPISPRSAWAPTASSSYASDPVTNVIDNTSARWSTGKPQSGNEWLQIDFGATVNLRTINLQQGNASDSNDYPRSYSVYVSDVDRDMTGSALATGVGTHGVSTGITLSKIASGRYLLIRQLGTSLSWWSVQELEVSCAED